MLSLTVAEVDAVEKKSFEHDLIPFRLEVLQQIEAVLNLEELDVLYTANATR